MWNRRLSHICMRLWWRVCRCCSFPLSWLLNSPWVVVDTKLKVVDKDVICILALRCESFPEMNRHSHTEDIEANRVLRTENDMVVSTARIVLTWCVDSEGVPGINSFGLKVLQEITEQEEGKVLKHR